MKRAVSVLLMLALTVSLTACMSCENLRFKRVDRCFDDLRGAFKMSDVTSSAELIGRRKTETEIGLSAAIPRSAKTRRGATRCSAARLRATDG